MLLPASCAVCGGRGEVVCATCEAGLTPAPTLAVPLHLDSCRALYAYDDLTRALLTRLKNRHRRDAVAWLADRLAADRPVTGSVVTWAPTSTMRRRRRGFDHAELLARAVARRWGLPARPLLRRLPGPAQSGRSAAQRRHNPAFVCDGRVPPSVVVVDDVITTGATITAAARALRSAGAVGVHGTVAARARPPRGARAAA